MIMRSNPYIPAKVGQRVGAPVASSLARSIGPRVSAGINRPQTTAWGAALVEGEHFVQVQGLAQILHSQIKCTN